MKTLCVYSTRSGLTEKAVQRIAEKCGCETMLITDGKDYSGIFGYFKAAVRGLSKKLPVLKPYKSSLPIDQYEKIIIAAPVWCEDICPFAKTFLKENKDKLKGEVYFVITHMSDLTYEEKIIKLKNQIAKSDFPHLSVKTHKNDYTAELDLFVNKNILSEK